MSRVIKSLKITKGHSHREHRSKKGRNYDRIKRRIKSWRLKRINRKLKIKEKRQRH